LFVEAYEKPINRSCVCVCVCVRVASGTKGQLREKVLDSEAQELRSDAIHPDAAIVADASVVSAQSHETSLKLSTSRESRLGRIEGRGSRSKTSEPRRAANS
jgi:hypothetical protein